jgi:hypothetical protein
MTQRVLVAFWVWVILSGVSLLWAMLASAWVEQAWVWPWQWDYAGRVIALIWNGFLTPFIACIAAWAECEDD